MNNKIYNRDYFFKKIINQVFKVNNKILLIYGTNYLLINKNKHVNNIYNRKK